MNFKTLLLLLLGCGVIGSGYCKDLSANRSEKSFEWIPAGGSDGDDFDRAVFYPQTKYSAKNWIFGATPAKNDDVFLLHLLDAATLRDVVPPLKVHHDFVEENYHDLHTKAVWNPSGDLVAISTGGRTWSDVYLFRVKDGKLTEIATPDQFSVIKKVDPVFTKNNRTWISNPVWIDNQTIRVDYSGNAYVPSNYTGGEIINGLADYGFAAFWKIMKDKAVFSPLP